MSEQITNGTWGHSSKVGGNEYFIFSVDRPGDAATLSGYERRNAMRGYLQTHNIPYKAVVGSYKGVTETSFVCNFIHLKEVIASGLLQEQESILHLGPCDARDRRPATLHGISATWSQYLGLFQSCDAETAKSHDGWTYDPTTHTWFVVLAVPAVDLSPEYRRDIDNAAYAVPRFFVSSWL